APFPPRAAGVSPDSAARDAGLKAGDVVLGADGAPVRTFNELQAIVKAAEGKPLALSVWRAGETFDVTLTPRRTDQPVATGGFETRYLIGLAGGYFFEPAVRTAGAGEALRGGAAQTWISAARSVPGRWHR